MTELARILRYWVLLTGAFILLATFIVTGAILYRTWQAERDFINGQRQLLERYFIGEYARISEELYLNLDNLDARRAEINRLIGSHAKVAVELNQNLTGVSVSLGQQPIFKWSMPDKNGTPDVLTVPLFFADRYLGSLRAHIEWRAGWSIGGFGRLGLTISSIVFALICAWLVAFLIFRRFVFAPLMEQTLSINRQAAISEAVQMLAHDVRKPFAALRMCLATLQKSKDSGVLQRTVDESLPAVDTMATEVEGMLSEILDSARPSSASTEPYRITDILKSCIDQELNIGTENKFINLSFECEDSLLTAIDPVQFRRVIRNIVKNAIEAVHRQGRIWIKTRQLVNSSSYCEICIANSGDPIPAQDIPHIFDSYFTKGKMGGTGLGLAIAKKFVVANGGSIRCHSDIERGTEFIITLPIASNLFIEKVDNSESIQDKVPHQNLGLNILLVDDDLNYRAALVQLFSGLNDAGLVNNLTLSEASSLAEAIDVLEAETIDLILVSDSLENLRHSSNELIRTLAPQKGKQFVCLHTGRPIDGAELSDRWYVPKPMDTSKALRLIAKFEKR